MKKFFSYLKEIGKELKKFASNNVKETIGLGIILAMFVLLFIIPKIILGLICVSLILGLGVVSLSSLLEDMQEGERIGFKYPLLSKATYIVASAIEVVCFIYLGYLVIKFFWFV